MRGGGKKNVKTTTESTPPDFLVGPLGDAANAASSQFAGSQGGTGNQIIPQGQQLIGNTLSGDFLSPDSNPYLQGTFNRAADLTQTRLSSEFAGAGRDQGAAVPARSEELQTLASNIFGGNYQAERGRQGQALGYGQQYDPTNLYINQLSGLVPGAGGTTESKQPFFKQGLFG